MSKRESNDNRAKHIRHELLNDVSNQVQKVLLEDFDLNLDQKKCEFLGNYISNHLAEYWGGQSLVIPKDHLYKIDERDLAIYDKVNRDNIADVAKEHGLSVNGLYRVIARIRGRAVSRKQRGLFDN